MNFFEIVLLGIGLAMDCFAVSFSKGMVVGQIKKGAFVMALFFGLFQAGMPLICYFIGINFVDFISKIAPWIALVLLCFIGGKMVWEHFSEKQNEGTSDYGLKTVLLLSVATSIDAFATGLLFVDRGGAIWQAVVVIGLFSFLLSLAGTLSGIFIGKKFHFPSGLIGGLILIAIGLKIWIEGFFGLSL